MHQFNPGQTGPGYQALRYGRRSQAGGVYHLRTSVASQGVPRLEGRLGAEATERLMSWQDVGDVLLCAFVVMPDHVHVLAALVGNRPIHESFGRWKNWCARMANRSIGRSGEFWQPGFFDRRVRREDDVGSIGRYIEHNPVRKELAVRSELYPFSSAHPAFESRMLGRAWLVTGKEP